jgi:hypothetical protein
MLFLFSIACFCFFVSYFFFIKKKGEKMQVVLYKSFSYLMYFYLISQFIVL